MPEAENYDIGKLSLQVQTGDFLDAFTKRVDVRKPMVFLCKCTVT